MPPTAKERANAIRSGAAPAPNGKPKPPQPNRTAALPATPCLHRSRDSIGKLVCNCSGKADIYSCNHPSVTSGHCVLELPKTVMDGPIARKAGGKTTEHYVPYPWSEQMEPLKSQLLPACLSCPVRKRPSDALMRAWQLGVVGCDDDGTCDVLHVVLGTPHWQYHADSYMANKPDGVVSAKITTTSGNDLKAAIQACKPRLVTCHAFVVGHDAIAALAPQFPNTRFWCILHASQNDLMHNSNWPLQQAQFLALSQRIPNVYYGTPESTAPFKALGYARYRPWFNVCRVPEARASAILDPPRVLLAGRVDVVKAYPASILALGLVARRRMIRVACAVKDKSPPLSALFESVGIQPEPLGWMATDDLHAYMRDNVSLVLQPSLTESFNYFCLEALTNGVPAIGSKTIRYLPDMWQVEQNDPGAIANAVCEVLETIDMARDAARQIGLSVAAKQSAAYQQSMLDMLTH